MLRAAHIPGQISRGNFGSGRLSETCRASSVGVNLLLAFRPPSGRVGYYAIGGPTGAVSGKPVAVIEDERGTGGSGSLGAEPVGIVVLSCRNYLTYKKKVDV